MNTKILWIWPNLTNVSEEMNQYYSTYQSSQLDLDLIKFILESLMSLALNNSRINYFETNSSLLKQFFLFPNTHLSTHHLPQTTNPPTPTFKWPNHRPTRKSHPQSQLNRSQTCLVCRPWKSSQTCLVCSWLNLSCFFRFDFCSIWSTTNG